MTHSRKVLSSAQKSAAFAPGEIEAFLQAKAAVDTCKQLEDEIKFLGLRIKRHEDKIMSLKKEGDTMRAILDLPERPMTERGSEMTTAHHILKVDDGNISREDPQIVFPKCSGTSCTPADYASPEQIRMTGLELEVLQDELEREVFYLHNVKSEYFAKRNEYLQLVDEGSPQCAGSGSSTAAKID